MFSQTQDPHLSTCGQSTFPTGLDIASAGPKTQLSEQNGENDSLL